MISFLCFDPFFYLAPAGADGPYANGVVAADAALCSELGRDILKKNGSAVDTAIATLFCIGIINMHSAGVGGGGFMTVYIKKSNEAKIFDYRERAPGMANRTMYINSNLSSKYGKKIKLLSSLQFAFSNKSICNCWNAKQPKAQGRNVLESTCTNETLLIECGLKTETIK